MRGATMNAKDPILGAVLLWIVVDIASVDAQESSGLTVHVDFEVVDRGRSGRRCRRGR
jgi:hypothetical protein